MDWTQEEVILIVKDYFEMFRMELEGNKYNKAAYRKKLAPLLKNRDKSIEYKHQNISAVLANMGLPYIKGYKPLFRYQQLLANEVAIFLQAHKGAFEKYFQRFVEEKVISGHKKIDFQKVVDKGPAKRVWEEKEPTFRPVKINYLVREQNNRDLGELGEKLVYEYEKWRLSNAGKSKLVEQVEWVSKYKGDGMGFDILSKNTNGTDRYIEVKTTKLSKEAPIFFSKNELKFSKLNQDQFFLYRVFNFKEQPQFFIKQGSYDNICIIQPQNYKGVF